MAKIRNKSVKRASRKIIEAHYPKLSTLFIDNKKVFSSGKIAKIATKRLRNKVVGYTTRLMIRLQKGAVNGISLKLQEEEREKRDNYVPEKSVFDVQGTEGSPETYEMLKQLGFKFQVKEMDKPRREYKKEAVE